MKYFIAKKIVATHQSTIMCLKMFMSEAMLQALLRRLGMNVIFHFSKKIVGFKKFQLFSIFRLRVRFFHGMETMFLSHRCSVFTESSDTFIASRHFLRSEKKYSDFFKVLFSWE
jgi:hypothetical protein